MHNAILMSCLFVSQTYFDNTLKYFLPWKNIHTILGEIIQLAFMCQTWYLALSMQYPVESHNNPVTSVL